MKLLEDTQKEAISKKLGSESSRKELGANFYRKLENNELENYFWKELDR